MSTLAHRISTFLLTTLLLVAVVAALNALPKVARSAEETVVPVVASSTESIPPPSTLPYKTEMLLGDEVVGDFVVGPGKIELEIKPGQTKIVEITVSNRTGSARIFELSTEDAAGSNDPTQTLVLLGDDRGPYSMKDYVTVSAPRFELPHNVRARIPVTISVPADAEPGGLYGSVLVSTVSKEAQTDESQGTAPQSAVVARIGTLFFITIPGAISKDGALKNFGTISDEKFFQKGPIKFGILFENKGAIHLTPYGELRIHNMLGEEVGTVELEPWFVLPLSTRLREVTWDRGFLFGRYTATAQINRSYGDTLDTMSYSFWVLPWNLLAAGFAVVFVVLFLIRTFFRTFEFKRKG